ncbi:YceI family protein [Epilithonimonas sp. UC225_85]|uniref:YceI family protein n=1 Tax=Epilithonimonas sp. UC225_85 TaxID=3350167 RepID=UPI0036D3E114
MKTTKNLISMSLVLAGLLLPQLSNAQKISQKSTNIKINGTSTLHDWDMSSAQSTFTGNVSGNVITDVRFVMKAESLKSKESAMDKNAYKALQTSKYPELTFVSSSILASGTSTITGNLTISNVTRTVKIPVTVTKNGASYIIKGNTKIKMSAFGIKPPTFMMGTIKTGDDLSIDININATN